MHSPTSTDRLWQLFQDCTLLSGGFDRVPLFDVVVAEGEPLVPVLLGLLVSDPPDAHPWVIFQLLRRIVGPGGPPIRPEDSGRLGPVRATWIAWGRARGLIPEERHA